MFRSLPRPHIDSSWRRITPPPHHHHHLQLKYFDWNTCKSFIRTCSTLSIIKSIKNQTFHFWSIFKLSQGLKFKKVCRYIAKKSNHKKITVNRNRSKIKGRGLHQRLWVLILHNKSCFKACKNSEIVWYAFIENNFLQNFIRCISAWIKILTFL